MSLKLAAFSYFIVFAVATVNARSGKIIGGEEADPHEFPHMVTLDGVDASDNHFCGGAIIDESWIITAAHCLAYVPLGRLRVRAGKHSLSTVEPTEQVIIVEKTFPHEKYPGGKTVAAHDIALLKLENPLVFNEYVQPIALPEQDSEFSGEVIFSGWGTMEYRQHPDTLRRGFMSIIDLKSCEKADIDIYGPPSSVTHTNVCTGSSNGVFACPGDSGGALIKQEGEKKQLVGVFSWLLNPCGRDGAPSVFTRVSLYINWIQGIISNNSD